MAEALQDAVEEPHLNSEDKSADKSSKHQLNGTDPDAQAMVISSLRSQIQDLFSQVTQLNSKLVKSYDRVSDLEDELHLASSNLRTSSIKISQLELERTQHLSALNTGLLVEKSHVTAELTRLMEKATEEAAQRGQAESARADIEKDLDDLSATLFNQANTMVAEARYAKALSERKVEEAERALKGAEEAVGVMQQQMQTLQAEKEQAEKSAQEMQMVMGKGKWVERQEDSSTPSTRFLSSHTPYQEFLFFVAHLRSIHPTSPTPPAMSTLLLLPFLTRLLTEDSEPTVRLDLAPSLNWLSRRSVLSAIHNGQLTIEPMSSNALLQESLYAATPSTIPGLNNNTNNISCALCGTTMFSKPTYNDRNYTRPPSHPTSGRANSHSNANSWSTSLFKNPLAYSNSTSTNNSRSPTPRPLPNNTPSQIHIFRLASPAAAPISSLPSSIPLALTASTFSSSSQPHPPHHPHAPNTAVNAVQTTIYPLCSNGWCLTRLRSTCIMWAFVRTGIIEKVWEEEVPNVPPPSNIPSSNGEKPPIPPRRRGLWGMASALGERAASWSEGDRKAPAQQVQERNKNLPAQPPPVHPTVAAASDTKSPRRVPPPLPKRSEGRGSSTPSRPSSSPTTRKPVPSIDVLPETSKTVSADMKPQLPLSPTFVPLPESRPSTPVNNPPSQTASPVSGAGGPPPPPLPRRAAARGPLVNSTPTTPARSAPTTDPAVEATEKESKSQDGAVAPATDSSIPDSEVPVAKTEPVVESTDEASTRIESTSLEVGKADGGEAPAHVVNGDAAEGMEKPKEAEVNGELLSGSPVSETRELDGGANGEGDEQKEVEVGNGGADGEVQDNGHGTSLNGVEKDVNGVESTEKESDETVKKEDGGEDQEAYVGDTTWEERTWKELMKLKEDMFWARVGGLR